MGIFRATKAFFRNSESKVAGAAGSRIVSTKIPRKVSRELSLAGNVGREAVETIDKYGVKTVFREGGGSLYNHAENTMYIDVKNGNSAVGVVHEATHARWAHEGRTADVTRHNRSDYVNINLDEETEAAVNEIRAAFEMRKNHIDVPVSNVQSHYVNGYEQAVRWSEYTGRVQHRPLSYAELDYAGRMGGQGAVHAAYHSGQIRGSVTGTPYPQYFGEGWDSYHAWYGQHGQMR
ncbi:hypothetical protein FB559_8723 [Actinoallomurus bryophytorum]|uniref:Uncharacterized protein n=2 Tax=Actinoallomurus bryophytorum TaxID=1490222 RepID=A0A543BTF0_9ACTN|nr:hypothetical protein FB559_8723 [Actinoallomurus bryophytorum]